MARCKECPPRTPPADVILPLLESVFNVRFNLSRQSALLFVRDAGAHTHTHTSGLVAEIYLELGAMFRASRCQIVKMCLHKRTLRKHLVKQIGRLYRSMFNCKLLACPKNQCISEIAGGHKLTILINSRNQRIDHREAVFHSATRHVFHLGDADTWRKVFQLQVF